MARPAFGQIDTDGDGLTDHQEIDIHGTDPMNPDTDGDTLTDADEILVHSTSAINRDTDGDTWHDGVETSAGSNPFVYDDNPLPNGLVAHWKFEGNYLDSSKSVADGFAHGRAHALALGVDGNCATIHGPGDAISLGTPEVLNQMIDQVTIAAWVYLNQASSHSYVFSNDGEGVGPYHGYALAASLSDDLPAFRIGNGTSVVVVQGTDPLTVGKWHHLVGTYDGKALKLYVNGELKGLQVNRGRIGRSASFESRIGSLGEGEMFDKSIDGKIDEVMVFDKALSSDEIAEIHSWCVDPVLTPEELVQKTATEIRLEATRLIGDPWGNPLPLAAHWSVGWNADPNLSAFDPDYQIGLIESGHHLLLTLDMPKPGESRTAPAITFYDKYYKNAIAKASAHHLPITLKASQWEGILYDTTYPFYDLSPLDNPGVIKWDSQVQDYVVWNSEADPAEPEKRWLSPFGPIEPWRQAGALWGDSTIPPGTLGTWLRRLQDTYPDPSLVIFLSNNEARQLTWTRIEESRRYFEHVAPVPDEGKRMIIAQGWVDRYGALFGGFRDELSNSAWQSTSRFVGFNAFGRELFARNDQWKEFSLLTANYIDPSPLMWGGGAPQAVSSVGSAKDYRVWSPQVESMNFLFMRKEASKLRQGADIDSDFWFELTVWDGGLDKPDDLWAWYADNGYGTFSPERGVGTNQFAMWLTRPRTVRHWRPHNATRSVFDDYFMATVEGVDRIYHNEVLQKFWRHGSLAPNRNHQHPYQAAVPDRYQSEDRWFLLDTSLDPERPYDLQTILPVFPLAYVLGDKPNREWLVYAHSPLQDREEVEMTIPEYGKITVDVPVGGAFYHVYESRLEAHWEFDEADGTVAADSSGNGHDGLLVNGATFSFDRWVGSRALSLDGEDDYVDVGEMSLGDRFTITAWAKLAPDHNNIQTLISNTSMGLASDGFKLFVNSRGTTNQKVFFETGNGNTGSQAKTEAGAFPVDQWNHVAVVIDRLDGTATIYVNGSNASFVRTTQTDFRVDGTVTIGQMNGQLPFTGNLDDVRIYRRRLTSHEIAELASMDGPTVPMAPNGLVALPSSNDEAHLFWSDNSDHEDAFEIERKTDDGVFAPLLSVAANVTDVIDESRLLDSTTYTYRVRATNIAGTSGYSNEYALTLLGAPSDLMATAVGDTQIDLSWQDNSDSEGVYVINRKIDDGDFAFYGTVTANTTAFSDTDVDPGTTYTYRVRASRPALGLLSGFSNEASATPGVPVAPSDLVATAANDGRIDLSWTDNSDNEIVFVIAQKIGDGAFTLVTTVPPDTTSYSVTGLDPSTTYTYRVRANGGAFGQSDFSNEASATTHAPAGDLDVGLVGYWLFDDANATIVADASGNGHHATLMNGATLVDADHGQGGSALSLDGQDDYADIGAVSFGDTFTIAFRAKRTGGFTATRTLIANSPQGFGPDGFKIFFNSWNTSDQRVVFETGNGSSGAQAKSVEGVVSSGKWDHIAVVVNRPAGVASIYVNGVDRTDPIRKTVLADFGVDAPVNIGQLIGGSLHFKGHIDDVRVYSRLLTGTEVQALVNAGG